MNIIHKIKYIYINRKFIYTRTHIYYIHICRLHYFFNFRILKSILYSREFSWPTNCQPFDNETYDKKCAFINLAKSINFVKKQMATHRHNVIT